MEDSKDRRCYAIKIVANFRIGEADYAKTLLREPSVPAFVVLVIMRVAVDLNGQSLGRAEEVANMGIDHVLAAKFVAQLRIGKVAPYANLQLRRIAAHLAGSFEKFLLRDHCPTPTPPLKGRGF